MSQVLLVTGASRGIGLALARLWSEQGGSVVLVARSEAALRAETQSLPKVRTEIIVGDVADESLVKRAVDRTYARFGRLDVLVNNAGRVATRSLAETSSQLWDELFAVNARAPFLFAREAFVRMKVQPQGGAIVNVSSLAGLQGVPKFAGLGAYASAKAALVALTESLAVEGAPYQIRAYTLAPGAVDTQMLQEAAPGYQTQTKPIDVAREIIELLKQPSGTLKALKNQPLAR